MLKVAIDMGDLEFCQRLIDEETCLSTGFDECDGCRPLLYLLYQSPLDEDRIKMAELMALSGASIKGTTCAKLLEENNGYRDYTVLHYAALFAYPGLLRNLLEKNSSSIFQLQTSIHPLHLAVFSAHLECVQLILDNYRRNDGKSKNPRSARGSRLTTRIDKNVQSSIGHAQPSISTGDLLELRIAGSQFNASPEESPLPSSLRTATPLIIAAYSGRTELARLLIEYGASPHTTDNKHQTALHFAAARDQPEVVGLLLDYGANVHAVNHALQTPIMIAAAYSSWASLQVLKARGANFRSRNCDGGTVLHHATSTQSIPFVQFLAMTGDEYLGQEDNRGTSPLARALGWGSWHKILSIINYAPTLGAYCPRLGNILTRAILNPEMTTSLLKKLLRRLSPPIVATLLEHRALCDGTPLYAACTTAPLPFQQSDIDVLLEAGADIEHVGGRHGTPLMGACAAGRLAVVKNLINKGAKLCYEGNDGTIISALRAAKYFPKIKRWILVERFTHGPRRILNSVNE